MSHRSKGKWEAIKNTSWGEKHVAQFGNKPGYVICHRNKNGEFVALASVIGIPFAGQEEIDANAKLIAAAPDLLKACMAVVQGGYGCAPSVEYMDELKKKCEEAIDYAVGQKK